MNKIIISVLCLSLFLMACSIIEFPKDGTGNVVATAVSCSDSDGGQTFLTAGTATVTYSDGTTKLNKDSCVCSKLLREYYCSGKTAASKTQACNSCVNGACDRTADPSIVCTDTDGGRNYNVYGEMRICGGSTSKDTCLMGNLNNPGDTAVASCDADGVRCKLRENVCGADGTGSYGNYVVPLGSKCLNGAVIVDPCPPVTTMNCSGNDIVQTVTKCGNVASQNVQKTCVQGCVVANGVPTCVEDCPEEKSYICSNWVVYEITKKCSVEQSRRQLNYYDKNRCENNQLMSLQCPNLNAQVAQWFSYGGVCGFGCSNDGKRCCDPVQDNLQVVQSAYCDGNTYVNATYIGCDGQQREPARQDCSNVQFWKNGLQNVPGQCRDVEGQLGCYACGYEYCIGEAYGPYLNYNQGASCGGNAHAVNVTCE